MKAKRFGQIKKLVRYPVKSMAGIEMDQTMLGWHGLVGDRRFAVRQVDNTGDFPWLTASKMPDLLLYRPAEFELDGAELLPSFSFSLLPPALSLGLPMPPSLDVYRFGRVSFISCRLSHLRSLLTLQLFVTAISLTQTLDFMAGLYRL